jgi:hypothetical protein
MAALLDACEAHGHAWQLLPVLSVLFCALLDLRQSIAQAMPLHISGQGGPLARGHIELVRQLYAV